MCPAIFRLTCRFIGSNSNSWFRLYPVSSTKTFSAERCRPAPYNCGECSTLYRPNTLIKTQHFHQDEHGYSQPQVPTPKVMRQQRHRAPLHNTRHYVFQPAKKAEPTGEVRTLRSSKQPDVPIYQNQRAAQAETVAQAHELKLSKAQAKRRRKKLRDGLGAI